MVLAEEHDVHNLRMIEANAPEVLEHVLPVGSVDELSISFQTRGTKLAITNAD